MPTFQEALEAGVLDGIYYVKSLENDIYRREMVFVLIPGAPKLSKGNVGMARMMIKGRECFSDDDQFSGIIINVKEEIENFANGFQGKSIIIRVQDRPFRDFNPWSNSENFLRDLENKKPKSGSLEDLRSQFAKPREGK